MSEVHEDPAKELSSNNSIFVFGCISIWRPKSEKKRHYRHRPLLCRWCNDFGLEGIPVKGEVYESKEQIRIQQKLC
jgi:hypothetical protein